MRKHSKLFGSQLPVNYMHVVFDNFTFLPLTNYDIVISIIFLDISSSYMISFL